MIMQRHATSLLIPQQIRSRTLLVTQLIISYNDYLFLRNNSLPNLKWTRLCTLKESIRSYNVFNSRLNDWFWYFFHSFLNLIYALAMKQDEAAYADQTNQFTRVLRHSIWIFRTWSLPLCPDCCSMATMCCTHYFCAATWSSLLIASADKKNKH